jgi:hypothetical protein
MKAQAAGEMNDPSGVGHLESPSDPLHRLEISRTKHFSRYGLKLCPRGGEIGDFYSGFIQDRVHPIRQVKEKAH